MQNWIGQDSYGRTGDPSRHSERMTARCLSYQTGRMPVATKSFSISLIFLRNLYTCSHISSDI